MNTLSYRTKFVNKANADKKWVVINAEDKVLGRLSSEVAKVLRGKHKATYTPHSDCGDNVIVINAEKVKLTGKKWSDKVYVSHTGYPGGQKFATPLDVKAKSAARLVEMAVRGMLPKNRLGRELFRNLYVYSGPEHEHEAQKPTELNV